MPHAFHFTLIKDTSHNFIYFEPCHPCWCKVALMLFHIKLIIKRRDRDRRPEPLCRVPRALYEDYRGSPSRITLQKIFSSTAACLRNDEHRPFSAKLDSHYFSLKVSFYNRQTEVEKENSITMMSFDKTSPVPSIPRSRLSLLANNYSTLKEVMKSEREQRIVNV